MILRNVRTNNYYTLIIINKTRIKYEQVADGKKLIKISEIKLI